MSEEDEIILQPKELKVNLYKHQLISVYHLEKLEREQCIVTDDMMYNISIGIFSDPTGYGKTLSIVALLLRDKMEWSGTEFIRENIISTNLSRIKEVRISKYKKLNCSLIVVPSSILSQWKNELGHSPLKVFYIWRTSHVTSLNVNEYDVIVVVSGFYNKLIDKYPDYAWKRFIFDEPHTHIPAMREIEAGFTWLVTATPSILEGLSSMFMKSLLGVKKYQSFRYGFSFPEKAIIKNELEVIEKSFSMPVTRHLFHVCYQPISKAVKGIVDQRILSMIDAGNIAGATELLGGTKTDNIVQLIKNRYLTELNNINRKLEYYNHGIFPRDKVKHESWLAKKTNLLSKIDCLDSRMKIMLSDPCNICLDTMENPVMEPSCQNMFCCKCILPWLANHSSCPLCRADTDVKTLIYIQTSGTGYKKKDRLLTKPEKIANIILDKLDGKFIIFSEHNHTFDLINNCFKENGINFVQIKGTTGTREGNINRFKSGDVNVIFLNATYNGAGINLQEATDIILYHEMGDSLKKQIIGRANRIGRTDSLTVHHLTTE